MRKKLLDYFIHILGYTVVLVCSSYLFDTFYIDPTHLYIYAFLISVVVFILNKTIKPIIVTLTIPLTGLTLGLFYFVINLFILKIADWILMSYFNLGNSIYAFFIAIAISIMNLFMEGLIVKPLIRRIEK